MACFASFGFFVATYFWITFWLLLYSVNQLLSPITSIMSTVFSVRLKPQAAGTNSPPLFRSPSMNLPSAAATEITVPRPPSMLNKTTTRMAIPPNQRRKDWKKSVQTTASMPPVTV
ncbi:MAG: hypothetical protein BWY09_03076 [Candidatus Hydrogenedentes bacterium ADurb.Bin179]|nr:MAG: hypothetical protein BWY09_03076 [Candidatus Hydrogenedentes bacterium ADurb.Bin179]